MKNKNQKPLKTIEEYYQFYLEQIKLKEELMHPQQKIIMRDTFFAAFGIYLNETLFAIADLSEDKGVKALESLNQQVCNHFKKRVSDKIKMHN